MWVDGKITRKWGDSADRELLGVASDLSIFQVLLLLLLIVAT